MPRAAGLIFAGFAGALLAVGAGCTFLISFDDVPRPDAGVVESSIPAPIIDSGDPSPNEPLDAGDDGGPPVGVPEVCDDKYPLNQIKGCDQYQDNGQVCADIAKDLTFPAGYDASTDVVTCSRVPTAHASCIKHCRGPGGCAHNPNTYPDQCDQCAGKANGTHCGSEMAGWPSDTFKLLVTCMNDRMTKSIACAGSCAAKGGVGTAACN